MKYATELLTWEQLAGIPEATVLVDEWEDGLRFIILRGPSHLCSYIGIPQNHPLAGFDTDDISINAHGGITFSAGGYGSLPKENWWYGWDYGHSGDCAFYDKPYEGPDKKRWLVTDVIKDSADAKWEMKKLMALAEKIFMKARKEAV